MDHIPECWRQAAATLLLLPPQPSLSMAWVVISYKIVLSLPNLIGNICRCKNFTSRRRRYSAVSSSSSHRQNVSPSGVTSSPSSLPHTLSHHLATALAFSARSPHAVPCLAAAVVYSNSLAGDFVHDDIPAVVRNPDVNGLAASAWGVFANDFWGFPMDSVASHKSYRPLTTLYMR